MSSTVHRETYRAKICHTTPKNKTLKAQGFHMVSYEQERSNKALLLMTLELYER